jgi:hypothetical protein
VTVITTQATEGNTPVCPGNIDVTNGVITCSQPWEIVSFTRLGDFDISQLDTTDLSQAFISGVLIIVLMAFVTKPLKAIIGMFK